MSMIRSVLVAALVGVVLSFSSTSQAVITGPYSVDANTLHLWQFDIAPPGAIPDAVGNSIPLNYLNSATNGGSFFQSAPNSVVNYGSALNVSGGSSQSAVSAVGLNVSTLEGTGGAFTFEAIIQLGFNPDSSGNDDYGILSMVNADSATSLFEFNYNKRGGTTADRIEFVVGPDIVGRGFLPTSGQDQPVQGGWYHVAVTYDGTPDGGLGMYWTRMDGYADAAAEPTQANALPLSLNDMPGALTAQSITTGQIVAGNAGSGFEFQGLVDQIRVSGIVRESTDFIFQVPEPSSVVLIAFGIASVGLLRWKTRKE